MRHEFVEAKPKKSWVAFDPSKKHWHLYSWTGLSQAPPFTTSEASACELYCRFTHQLLVVFEMAQNVDENLSGWKKSPICDPQISCRPAVCAKLAAMVSPAPNPRLNAEAPVPNPRSARPLVVMPAELFHVGESFSQVQQSHVPHWVAFSTCLPGKMDLKRGDVCFGVAVRDHFLLLSGKLRLQSRIHRLDMCFLSSWVREWVFSNNCICLTNSTGTPSSPCPFFSTQNSTDKKKSLTQLTPELPRSKRAVLLRDTREGRLLHVHQWITTTSSHDPWRFGNLKISLQAPSRLVEVIYYFQCHHRTGPWVASPANLPSSAKVVSVFFRSNKTESSKVAPNILGSSKISLPIIMDEVENYHVSQRKL